MAVTLDFCNTLSCMKMWQMIHQKKKNEKFDKCIFLFLFLRYYQNYGHKILKYISFWTASVFKILKYISELYEKKKIENLKWNTKTVTGKNEFYINLSKLLIYFQFWKQSNIADKKSLSEMYLSRKLWIVLHNS